MLSAAAKYASIVGVNPELTSGVAGLEAAKTAVSARYLERIAWVREAAGDRFASIELQVLGQIEQVVPNRLEVAAGLAPAFGLTPEEALQMPIVLVGTVDEICADLVERREKYGFSYIVVHDMDAFARDIADQRDHGGCLADTGSMHPNQRSVRACNGGLAVALAAPSVFFLALGGTKREVGSDDWINRRACPTIGR